MQYYIIFKNDQVKSVNISVKQLEAMADKINNGNAFVVGGSMYHGWEIKRIMSGEDYHAWENHNRQIEAKKERKQILMSGHWQCRYGYLHTRKAECGHHLQHGGSESTEDEFDYKVRRGEYDWLEGDVTKLGESKEKKLPRDYLSQYLEHHEPTEYGKKYLKMKSQLLSKN